MKNTKKYLTPQLDIEKLNMYDVMTASDNNFEDELDNEKVALKTIWNWGL